MSYVAKPSEIERKWYILDAEGKTLGAYAEPVRWMADTITLEE